MSDPRHESLTLLVHEFTAKENNFQEMLDAAIREIATEQKVGVHFVAGKLVVNVTLARALSRYSARALWVIFYRSKRLVETS